MNMKDMEKIKELFELSEKISYKFRQTDNVMTVLTNSNTAFIKLEKRREYQRLEFLGDAVVSMVIAEHLYFTHPLGDEGKLALMRTNLVSAAAMHKVADTINLSSYIEYHDDTPYSKVLANTLEALIGAVYLDSDYNSVKIVILNLWRDMLNGSSTDLLKQDAKSMLQQHSLKLNKSLPKYVQEEMADMTHDIFTFKVFIDNSDLCGTGVGHSKKAAQVNAAEDLLAKLQQH